jgi:pectin methylesterase-like acyl-CoA thioesterase
MFGSSHKAWRSMAWAAACSAAACGQRSEVLATIVTLPSEAGASRDAAVAKDVSAGDAAREGEAGDSSLLRLVVAADGSGQFLTVQAAVDSIPKDSTFPVEIDIKPGTYKQKLNIVRDSLSLIGDDPSTTVLTFDQTAADAGGTTYSASVTVVSDDFTAQNVTFENSAPLGSTQAVALYTSGDRQQFQNCRFTSYQDTIYLKNGSAYFKSCYVAGDNDYIMGASTAVFDGCTIHNASGGVAITFPNTDVSAPYGFVFLGGTLTADSSVDTDSIALGRPWGPYGSTIFVDTELGSHILAKGWVASSDTDLSHARFAEYKSQGPGADPTMRAPESRQLTDAEATALTLPTIFGGWIPSLSH